MRSATTGAAVAPWSNSSNEMRVALGWVLPPE